MMKHRIGAVAAMALCILAALPSCATRRVEAPKAVPPGARVKSIGAVALDQHRTRLPFVLELDNPRPESLTLDRYDCVLLVNGVEAGRATKAEPRCLGPGESVALPFEFVADARKLGGDFSSPDGPAEAPFRIEARLALRDATGRVEEAKAATAGAFPIIREPRLRILSLEIERDILVTTNLRLSIEAYNPNAFPVEMGGFAYVFDGEGKPWADGRAPGPFKIPARSSGKVELAFEMNFADRDRSLLDLVAKLQVVNYRLEGTASVSANPGFPLVFPLKYDESGSCQVER
jgi:LEA14-like dessication related protein